MLCRPIRGRTTVTSGAITLINLGWVDDLLARWLLQAFPSAWVIAFPIALFVVPAVRRLVGRVVESQDTG